MMNLLNEVKNACKELEDERGRHAAVLMGAVQREDTIHELTGNAINGEVALELSNITQERVTVRNDDLQMLQDAYTTLRINPDSTDKQREEAWTALSILIQGDMGGPPQLERHINAVDDSIQAEIDHQRSRAAAHRNRARNLLK
jgi:hypothetical protein